MREMGNWREYQKQRLANDQEAAIDYLQLTVEEYLADGDLPFFLKGLRTFIESQGGVSELSKRTNIESEILLDALSNEDVPLFDILNTILNAFGCQLLVQHKADANVSIKIFTANPLKRTATQEGREKNEKNKMKFDDRQLFTLEQMAKSYINVSTHIDNSVFQGVIATLTNDFLGVYIYTQPIMSQLIMGIELMMKLLHYKSGGSKIAGHQIAPIYNKLNENVRNLVEKAYTDTINEVFYTDTNETPAMNPTLQDGKYVTKTHDGRYVISVDMDNMPLVTEFTNLYAKTIDITPKFIFQLDNDFKNIETFIKILDNVKMYDRYNFFEDMPLEKYLVIRPSSKLLRTFISKIFALIKNNNKPEKINNMKNKNNNQGNNEQNEQEQKLLVETFNQITKKIEVYRYNIMTYIYPENNNYKIYLAFFETTDNMPDILTMSNMSEKDILDNFTKFIRSYQNEAEAKSFVDGMMHIIRNPLAPPDLGIIHTIINSLENN